MKEKRIRDKSLLMMGSILTVLTLAVLIAYQACNSVYEGDPYVVTKDMERKATVEGYSTPEEVVEYVVYQIHQGDLDLALRGCAIQEVAEYFSLQGYGEILDKFPYTQTLAPADYDNRAYIEINQARMTAIYSDMLEQCMGIFGDGYDLEILGIRADIPENADGFYYQDIRDIGTVSGARDACNVIVDMCVDGVQRQMTITVAKYRKYWKILQFSEYKNNLCIEPQISEYVAETENILLPIPWEDMEGQILSCNYQVADSRKEKNIEAMVRKIFIYLQRGEIWKVLAYYDLYDQKSEFYPDSIFFDRQSKAAEELQEFYYRTLLYDKGKMSWINQNVKSEAVNLTALLDASVMIYSDLSSVEVAEIGEQRARCKIRYQYDKKWFDSMIYLIYKDGWKITGFMKTGWKDIDGDWYYLDDNGTALTGWQKIEDDWYYLDVVGVMQTGWQRIKGVWYYLGDDGAMQKGWAKIDGLWYYFDFNGAMQTGWQKIYGNWYYLDSEDGIMATNTYIDGYYVNADGVWIPEF